MFSGKWKCEFNIISYQQKHEWNTEKYSASASHNPMRPNAELIMGRDAIFFHISTSAHVITYLSSSKLDTCHRTHKTHVVILAVQHRFIPPLHSANLIKSDWRISAYLKIIQVISIDDW